MEPRLIECLRVLKDTGSLYLHCDPTASHYLKVMLDSVFGIKQFRNEIIIHKISGNKSGCEQAYYPNRHDIILLYAKGAKNTFHKLYEPLTQSYINDCFTQKDVKGRLYSRDKRLKGELYLDEHKGKLIGTLWEHKLNLNSHEPERTGYPTQKSFRLYIRMIQASSNQGDVVLDPFAGSGTTLDAAESLGRKWIGIDIGDEAIEIIQTRLRDRHGLMLEYELCLRRSMINPNTVKRY